ncbi:MAG: hypothetical protein IKP17_03145 [Oscillospiraceae bacterium]|nr:hypothetical protein [Oscillospiraceae bacterium]MBR4691732.1 hypothetical protein [Oscillospiraceae bacterium]
MPNPTDFFMISVGFLSFLAILLRALQPFCHVDPPALPLRAQAHRRLVKIRNGVDVHISDLPVVQPGDDALQVLARQEVRVVLFCGLVDVRHLPPRHSAFPVDVGFIGGASGKEVDIAEDFIHIRDKVAVKPLPVLLQLLEHFQRPLLHLLQLPVHALPPGGFLPLLPLLLLSGEALRPLPVQPLAELLPLLCQLFLRLVPQPDLKPGLVRIAPQRPVQLPLHVVQQLVLADVFAADHVCGVFRQAQLLVPALSRQMHHPLQEVPRVRLVLRE